MRQMSKKFKIVKLENGLYNVVDSERNALFKKEDAPTILFVSNRKPLEEITMFYAIKKQKDGEKKCQKTVFFLNGEDYPEIKWFDDVTVYENDVVLVKLDGKYNVLDKDNTFRFAEWFDNIVSNKMGTVHIALKDGKYNVYVKLYNKKSDLQSIPFSITAFTGNYVKTEVFHFINPVKGSIIAITTLTFKDGKVITPIMFNK